MNAVAKVKYYLKVFNDASLLSSFSERSLSEFFIFLRAANLLSIFSYKIKRKQLLNLLPESFYWHIESNINYAERQFYQVEVEIDRIDLILKEAGITPVFLKGAAYNIEKVPSLVGRTMSDIDILVPSSDIKATEERLLSLGWQAKELDNYNEKYYREFAHEIPPLFDPITGTTLDIHHNIYLPVSGKAPDESLLRQNVVATANEKFVLEKHMQAIHTCLHLYWNEDVTCSLRDLYDFTCICKEYSSSCFWEEMTKTAQTMNLCSLVLDVLRLAEFFFELQYPDNVKEQLSSNEDAFSKLRQSITLFVMKRAIIPNTRACKSFILDIFRILAYLRGHLLKMPLCVLVPHILKKITLNLKKS